MENKINLPNGHNIVLDGIKYKIIEFLGHGGSSIVYRAEGSEGFVIIKEVFPKEFKDDITRKSFEKGKEDMTLDIPPECQDECQESMKMYKERAKAEFKFAKKLRKDTEKTESIWIAKYNEPKELNDTLYTVIENSYKGEMLKSMLSAESRATHFKDFSSVCEQVLRILEALKPLHDHRDGVHLHRDISPDNIFVFEDTVANMRMTHLIDFNSVYKVDSNEKDQLLSIKEPYSPPELNPISLYYTQELDKATDLYSVAVIFFEMLMGRAPKGYDWHAWSRGENIFLNPSNSCKYVEPLFSRTKKKLNNVLKRGLRLNATARYQDIGELWAEIEILIEDAEVKKKYKLRLEKQLDKIDESKASNSKIYELLYDNDAYIPMMAKHADSETMYSLDELLPQLEVNGYRHAVLTGDGGMGKTTTSLRALESCLNKHEQAVYIPLNDYSPNLTLEKSIKAAFEIIGDENTPMTHKNYLSLMKEEEIVLILDGFNEISDFEGNVYSEEYDDDKSVTRSEYVKRTKYENEGALLKELEELAKKDFVRIVITSRSSINRIPLNLDSFAKLECEKITPEYIVNWLSAHLPAKYIDFTKADLPFDVLGIPMLLKMYTIDIEKQRKLSDAQKKQFLNEPNTAGEILWNYIEHQIIISETIYEGKFDTPMMRGGTPFRDFGKVLFRHLLPYIAYRVETENEKKGNSDRLVFAVPELKNYLKDYEILFNKYIDEPEAKALSALEEAFYVFFKENIKHTVLTNPCCDVFAILETKDKNESFTFIHRYFRDFFSAAHIRNQMILNDKKVFTERIFPFHISRMLLEILQEHKYVPPGKE